MWLKIYVITQNDVQKKEENLLKRYDNDPKMTYMHKWVKDINSKINLGELIISKNDSEIEETLLLIKNYIDTKLNNNNSLLNQRNVLKKIIIQVITREEIKIPQAYKEKFVNEIIEQYKKN
ncbi:hypothetical protein AXW82_00580 [Mycoplasmopsis canis PG 14]|uniref:Uncharacterized protein n=1 Tax=Mycoplasmopsis canis TaxID=29555 RepID=A0A449AR87_9BACT|nr:hypothetical protein [Mycoplasmopsis canis]AMD81063.1 hypothetical protein AXW82_00580 [Mycoplasmopsis canis PG 14]VEU68876.1 Uncharacterised protein [Mycoplasmopsis canis]